MKLLKQLFPVLVVLVLWSSCTEDDSPIPSVVPPSSSVSSSSETIAANGTFSVVLSAQSGESPLETLTIQKDGSDLDFADITIDGSVASANPRLLFNAETTSFTYDITIQTDLMAGESANYTFIVDAVNNDNTTETVVVDVLVPTIPPTLEFVNPGDWPNIMPGSILPNDPIVATQTDALLATFAAYEDGVLMDTTRLYFGATQFSENPRILTADEQDGFNADLGVKAHTEEGTRTYMYILTDVNGLSDTASYMVEVVASTPLTSNVTGVMFYNRAGTMDGGLDLVAGAAVSSTSGLAHIRDLGIDQNMAQDINWIKQIEAVNNSIVFLLPNDNFDAISSKEDVATEYATGTVAPTTLTAGTVIGVEAADGTKFIVKFDQVNNTTGMDNNDNYSVSIKY